MSRPTIRNSAPINTLETLLKTLSISSDQLEEILALSAGERYTKPLNDVHKKDGSIRKIRCPHHSLRVIQRRISKRLIYDKVIWPEYLFGSIRTRDYEDLSERDYISCAAKHCGAKSLIKIDVENFFDNVSRETVVGIFKDLIRCSDKNSELLSEICCYEDNLVQGAITSSALAMLALWDIEGKVVDRLARKGLVYTRLVDDITISSKSHNFNFDHALNIVKQMLYEKDLPFNQAKTKIERLSSEALTVHGLRVAFKEPRLPSSEPRVIRSYVQRLEKLASDGFHRRTADYRKDYNRCVGKVVKLHRVKHNKYRPLKDRLDRIPPLPSKRDLKVVEKLICRLERDYNSETKGIGGGKYQDTYWYKKRYSRIMYRLSIVKRSYKNKYDEYIERLDKVKPDTKGLYND
ncbi:reverse transcriptase family protein [Shewanella algae]|uniref:reverse transcriptase family protein n=1 Tax=Shewanella algae TaxID=38313 RepID=UPI001F29296E|nr:reverse transcriptase family protein [Shewanella algae]MCE9783089.1 reverse transcriptase family protein [Shewanella algae]